MRNVLGGVISVNTVLDAEPTYYIYLTKTSLPADPDGHLLEAATKATLTAYLYMKTPGSSAATRPTASTVWFRIYRVVNGAKTTFKSAAKANNISLTTANLVSLQSYALESIEIQAFSNSGYSVPYGEAVSIQIVRQGDPTTLYDILCPLALKPTDDYVNVRIERTDGSGTPVVKDLGAAYSDWGVELTTNNANVTVEQDDSQIDVTGLTLTSGLEVKLIASISGSQVAEKILRCVLDGNDAQTFYLVSDIQSLEADSDGLVYATRQVTFSLYTKVGSNAAQLYTPASMVVSRVKNDGTTASMGSTSQSHTISLQVAKNLDAVTIICHAYDSSSNDICVPLSIPVVKTGKQGAMNVRPIVYRISEWEPGKEYHNDTEVTATDTDRYIDIVTVGVNSSGFPNQAFIYRNSTERSAISSQYAGSEYSSHTSIDEDFDANDNTTLCGRPTTSSGTPYWLWMENFQQPLMAPLAYFVQAIIQYLQVGQISFVQNGVVKGAIGYSELGAPLFLGGASAELANFRVSYEGVMYAVGADVSGTVRVTNTNGEEKVLISADEISQGLIDEGNSYASSSFDKSPTKTAGTNTVNVTLSSYGSELTGSTEREITAEVFMTLEDSSDQAFLASGMTVTLNYSWVQNGSIVGYKTSSITISASETDSLKIATLKYTPTVDNCTLKLYLSSMSIVENGAIKAYSGSMTLSITINEYLSPNRKIRVAPNGLLVGGDTRSWAYIDSNRMELRTGDHGIRSLIGGSATGGIEGVQVLRALYGGAKEWMSIYGKAVTITANYTVTRDIRYIISTATSDITITLPNVSYNGHEVFVKKFGNGTVTLKGAAGNIVVQANAITVSESYTLNTSPAALVVFVNGLWFVMRGGS